MLGHVVPMSTRSGPTMTYCCTTLHPAVPFLCSFVDEDSDAHEQSRRLAQLKCSQDARVDSPCRALKSKAKHCHGPEKSKGSFLLDFREESGQYSVIAELPGLTRDQLELFAEKRNLVIRVKCKARTRSVPKVEHVDEKNADSSVDVQDSGTDTTPERRASTTWLLKERTDLGGACRSVLLPDDADLESITASLDNGLLSLCVPKLVPIGPKVISIS